MSSVLGVRQWFPTEPGDLAREFGISFVGDDDEVVKQECLSPTGDGGAYGGVFMVNSGGEPFGPVSDDAAAACTVVLDPLLRSLTGEGQISAEQTLPLVDQCRRSSGESAVRGLLRDLVSTVATSDGVGDQDESLLQRPPVAPPIDDERKAVQRRRSSSSGGKCKRRKRSTSCSTTSSTGSAASRHHHHHHHKHRKHRRRKSKTSGDELDGSTPTPRVNPIFVWVKQDNTRIVEVLCEDYDKRNRIRIKRTAQGWRAIPRTERLASAGTVTAPPSSSTGEAPQCTVTSSLVSKDANPIEEEEEEEEEEEDDDDDDPITKETFEEGNEIEGCLQEVEGYPEIEQAEEEDDTYEPVQDQACTDSEMEPTDLSIPKTTFGEIEIIPLKGMNPILPAAPPPIHSPATIEPIPPSPVVRPAHQPKPQHKSMFLESLLSSPRKCHPMTKLEQASEELQPLDLGMSLTRSSGSPTVSCSEERKPLPPPETDIEPKVKRLKVEDITLKNLLNKTVALDKERKTPTEILLDSSKSQKSRLLELLTSEPAPASQVSLDQDLSPLTQLKKILSDPELSVPDPLLVPRDRLHSLIVCPAREIPHLLSVRPELRLPEALAYPALVRDPDLLVVSLTHLQRLLEKPEDDTGNYITLRDWQRYQTELIDSQLKQQQHHQQHQNPNGGDLPGDLDAGTAAALNQLLWLPYLTQLEAAAMACGNNQEFLTMLNAVFPPTNYPQVQGRSASFLPPFAVPPTDFKTQMELQQTLALWQEAMVQATVNASSVNNNNSTSNNNNLLPPKNNSGTNKNRFPHLAKKLNSSSARTSPISPNFQHAQHQQRSATNNQQYLSTNGYNHHHQYNQQRSHLQQPARNSTGPQRPLKSEIHTPKDTDRLSNSKPKVTCKSLINLLSNTKKQEQHQELATIKRCPSTPSPQQRQHSHLLAALGNPPGNMPHLVPITHEPVHAPTNNPIDLSGRARSKLKVKQHLVDPAITPRLLKQDADKAGHPQLWHPLFGSQKTSYNSPWQWTTVMVNGE